MSRKRSGRNSQSPSYRTKGLGPEYTPQLEHVEDRIDDLNGVIAELKADNQHHLASLTRAMGAVELYSYAAEHSGQDAVRRRVSKWCRHELPQADYEKLKKIRDEFIQPDDNDNNDDGRSDENTHDAEETDEADIQLEETEPKFDFEDLIGPDIRQTVATQILTEIMAAVEMDGEIPVFQQETSNPGSFLFEGHPGTGKTMSAQAIVSALSELGYDAGFYSVPATMVKDSDYGESETRLKEILRTADDDENELSVVFFDEFDTIAERTGHRATAAIANTLQQLVEGTDPVDSVVVIGATNYSERVSEAIKSRFTRVEFNEPTRKAKEKMLASYLGTAQDFPDDQLGTLDDELMDGLTGRDLKSAVVRALQASFIGLEEDGSLDDDLPASIEDLKDVQSQLENTPQVSASLLEESLALQNSSATGRQENN